VASSSRTTERLSRSSSSNWPAETAHQKIAPIAKTRMTDDIDSIPAEYRPEDVSPVVVFLASDGSRYVHGEILVVDGGWMGR